MRLITSCAHVSSLSLTTVLGLLGFAFSYPSTSSGSVLRQCSVPLWVRKNPSKPSMGRAPTYPHYLSNRPGACPNLGLASIGRSSLSASSARCSKRRQGFRMGQHASAEPRLTSLH